VVVVGSALPIIDALEKERLLAFARIWIPVPVEFSPV